MTQAFQAYFADSSRSAAEGHAHLDQDHGHPLSLAPTMQQPLNPLAEPASSTGIFR